MYVCMYVEKKAVVCSARVPPIYIEIRPSKAPTSPHTVLQALVIGVPPIYIEIRPRFELPMCGSPAGQAPQSGYRSGLSQAQQGLLSPLPSSRLPSPARGGPASYALGPVVHPLFASTHEARESTARCSSPKGCTDSLASWAPLASHIHHTSHLRHRNLTSTADRRNSAPTRGLASPGGHPPKY